MFGKRIFRTYLNLLQKNSCFDHFLLNKDFLNISLKKIIDHVLCFTFKACLKENSVFLKPRPYFLFEIRLSTHREQFGEDRRPLRAI